MRPIRDHPFLALYSAGVLVVLFWLVATMLAPNERRNVGCGGFGCDWSVQDRLFFYGLMYGLPMLCATLVVGTILIAIRRRSRA